MKPISLLLVLLALGCFASAQPHQPERILKHTAHPCILSNSCLSRDWVKAERAGPEEFVRLVFAIRQKNLDQLEEILLEVSSPRSPLYGQHLTHKEIGQLTKDTQALRGAQAFLVRHGILKFRVTINGDFIVARMTVSKAEELLSCELFHFHSPTQKTDVIRTLNYSLPKAVFDFIDFVGYTVQFPPTLIPAPVIQSFGSNGVVTPDVLATFYNIEPRTVQNQGATQSLFESLGQSFSPADLATFQAKYNIPSDPVSTVIGPNKPSACSNINNCDEANLDVQYIMAIAEGAPTTFWSIPNSNSDIFLEWIVAVTNTANPPLVHSMSYLSTESEEVDSNMKSFSTSAMKLGAQGVSILIASGDDGVASYLARGKPSACGFFPSFPASCPYITAVGATQGPESGSPEVACSSNTGGGITTGGGFSTVFSQPSYQTDAINAYLSSANLPPSSMWNSAGRGYPDLSLMGHNYDICAGGKFFQGSGTSASTPSVAGMITLVNGARLNIGKPPLGFLNPMIYEQGGNGTVFNDITSGENNCAAQTTSTTCCKYGFFATEGWDPLTGWGSVDFTKLLKAAA